MDKDQNLDDYFKFLKVSLPEWASISFGDVEFFKFHSYSNTVYKVETQKTVQPSRVLFRVLNPLFYGQPKENFGFLPPAKEHEIFAELSNLKLGPTFYAYNKTYRIEEFLNSDQIANDAILDPENRAWFTRWAANFNKLSPKFFENLDPNYKKYYKTIVPKEVQDILEAKQIPSDKKELIESIKSIFTDDMIKYLQDVYPNDECTFHGDLNFANILKDKNTKEIKLIDYERAGISIRGDEIACFIFYSLINAYHGDFKEYPEHFPSEEIFQEFSELYIIFSDLDFESSYDIITKKEINNMIESNRKNEEYQNKVKDMVRKIKICLMNCCYVNCFGCAKFNFIPDPEKNIEYCYACYKYFIKLKEELDVQIKN